MASWLDKIFGSRDQKRRWRELKARMDALPDPHRASAKAVLRYLMYSGGITDGETIVTMMADYVELWERAVADGTPVREIVGDDPSAFAESFVEAYSGRKWIDKERARLDKAIRDAENGGRP
ncbi:MAG: DUF1048 domain-containing protein [Microbacterium sp.]|uniref:DUF1048 domain-containing protein n=1 Tax=Microbacterium sp. TaxID=51671 RepID=UPI0039E61DAD